MLKLTTSASKPEGAGGKVTTFDTFCTSPTQVTSLSADCLPSPPYAACVGSAEGRQTFSLAGIDDTLALGSIISLHYAGGAAPQPVSGWVYSNLPPVVGSVPNCQYSHLFEAAIPSDRMWALVKQAFDQDLLLAASGWVQVLASVAPTGAGAPAPSAKRILHVTSVTLTRPPRAAGGGGAGGSSAAGAGAGAGGGSSQGEGLDPSQ